MGLAETGERRFHGMPIVEDRADETEFALGAGFGNGATHLSFLQDSVHEKPVGNPAPLSTLGQPRPSGAQCL